MTGDYRSIGQPVATGAGAIPARLRTPDPHYGGMRGKEMKKDEYRSEYEPGLLRELRRVGMLAGDVGTIRNLVAHLHAAYGHEKAKATLDAILEAMAWASCEPGAIDELVSIANDFVHKLLAPIESSGSQKDGSEAP